MLMDIFEDAEKRDERNENFEEGKSLDRQSILNSPDSRKKNFGIFGLVLMGLAALLLIFLFNGKDKSKDGLQKEAEEFEPASRRPVVVPQLPPSLPPLPEKGPSEDELAR